jgi:general secretion pathway protein L
MTTLIITLPQEPCTATTLYDYVLSPDGNAVGEQSRAVLALLPQVGKTGAEVVALVSAAKLSWHQVQLPKGTLGRRFFQEGGDLRLRAVLEGLLEDRLLDDVEQLHFALEPQATTDAPVWVAVCERAWLRSALQALEQAGFELSRVVPDFAPDADTDTLHVLGQADAAQMVFVQADGVAVWPLSAASVALLNWPQERPIVAEPAVVALAEQLFKRTVTLQPAAQRHLQALQSSWDLAQFDLVNSNRARTWKRWATVGATLLQAPRWRAARVALLALLLVNLAGLNAWAWKQQAAIKAQKLSINQVLTSTFPKVRVVVDAPIQMAKEVAVLQQASGAASGRDLESMLGAFGSVSTVAAVPAAIEFVPGELRMKGLNLKAEELSALSFKLRSQGYLASAEGESVVIKPVAGS